MENESNKKNTPDIDEELMMNLMVDGVKKEGLKLPLQPETEATEKEFAHPKETVQDKSSSKEKKRPRKNAETDYESVFLKKTETNARDGKTVYIRPEFHQKLTRIIHVIGQDKISIYAYLDNLLDHHFQEFSEQITKSYNQNYKPI